VARRDERWFVALVAVVDRLIYSSVAALGVCLASMLIQ
jgi:hypothetical protein